MITALGRLLLLRLSIAPAVKPLTPATVRKDLAAALSAPVTESSLAAAREELIAAGLAAVFVPTLKASAAKSSRKPPAVQPVDPTLIGATAAGRAAAAAILKIDAIPAMTWPKLLSQLTLVAMGLPAGSTPPTAATLLPKLVSQKLGLKPGLTKGKLLEAIAFAELGFDRVSSWAELKSEALNRRLGRTSGQSVHIVGSELESQVLLAELELTRATPASIKAKVLRDWLGQESRPEAGAETAPQGSADSNEPFPPALAPRAELDLHDFARQALTAARTVPPAGWFGQNKVYINQAWRLYNAQAGTNGLSLITFKSRLVEAHRAALLTLSRADLVAAMSAADIAESEARYLNAQFHFILVEGNRI